MMIPQTIDLFTGYDPVSGLFSEKLLMKFYNNCRVMFHMCVSVKKGSE